MSMSLPLPGPSWWVIWDFLKAMKGGEGSELTMLLLDPDWQEGNQPSGGGL